MQTYDADSDFGNNTVQWDVTAYVSKIKVNIINESEDGMALEFDLVGVEAPIANAVRRILIAEVRFLLHKIYSTSVLFGC